ncbi:MAG TPA: response regulator transcription factor [Acidimicrobiales bacterium]|nr:response regulator transcription factor [Acidimicrobiales bacterium]
MSEEEVEVAPVIRVLVADDQELYRRGLDVVLSTEEDISVVAEAGNGEEAVVRAVECAPDIVLMDIRMPKIDGIEAARQIKDQVPSTRIIMLTVSDDDTHLYDAIKAGANGYLLKDLAIEEVPEAIRKVHSGESLISPSMASKLLTEFSTLSKKVEQRQQLNTPVLTPREIEVLKLVAKGMSNREIADELYISENTVKNHVRNILEKLHLHSRMEAVLYAMRERILDLSDDS